MKKYFPILFAFIIFFIGGSDVFAYDFAHWKGANVTQFSYRLSNNQWYSRRSTDKFVWLFLPDFGGASPFVSFYQFGGTFEIDNYTLEKGTATVQFAMGYIDDGTSSLSVCKTLSSYDRYVLDYSSNGDNYASFPVTSFNCVPQDGFVILNFNITVSQTVDFKYIAMGLQNDKTSSNQMQTLFTAVNIVSSADGTEAIINQIQTMIDSTNTLIFQNNEAEQTRKGILATIRDLPNSFMNMLKGLFIPDEDYFEDWFDDLKTFFEEKLGFLATPFTIFIDFVNMYLNLDASTDIIIDIPDITVPNFEEHKIVSATTFNWSELLRSKDSLNALWQLYLSFIDVYLILNFIGLCENTYNRIFGGDTSNYEYYTVEDSVSYDGQTGEVTSRRQNERRTTKRRVN